MNSKTGSLSVPPQCTGPLIKGAWVISPTPTKPGQPLQVTVVNGNGEQIKATLHRVLIKHHTQATLVARTRTDQEEVWFRTGAVSHDEAAVRSLENSSDKRSLIVLQITSSGTLL